MKNVRKVTRSSENVVINLRLQEAERLRVKAQIIVAIGNEIRERRLTQTAAAARLKLTQPDVSRLLLGLPEGYSLERLICFLLLLGNHVTISVEKVANERNERGSLTLARA